MSLMVLGTASHVGKSLTVAAICRYFANKNVSVAPFKSQNMSLNSFVTPDGAEIGMAQAMQASAARLPPSADMNPVLLKPMGDSISQIVLLGRPYRDLPITEYYQEAPVLLDVAIAAFRRLEKQYGHVVVEGAGGAAELNLYDRDIANILLAKALRLPILLVADIERGGVFAQVYGTMMLLPEEIRALVVGVIINKFRGDPGLFSRGVDAIEELCGVPVLGVVPYADIPVPSEDSLSIGDKRGRDSPIRIAVIRLPRISNFTDFELLERMVSVEYVSPGRSLEPFDCIILPGTKNSVEDLLLLWEKGAASEILRARERKVPIIGICGGYQMLGKSLTDCGIESGAGGSYHGLALLDLSTYFEEYTKTTVQVTRRASAVEPLLSRIGEVTGYEIHMGHTVTGNERHSFGDEGAVSRDGLVIGTYMHGLFQNKNAAEALVSFLYERRGLTWPGPGVDCEEGKTQEEGLLDSLADHFAAHLDMETIGAYLTGK
ncbi:MAG: cobyric acid synthase [Methanomicrobiaceae archaeon]|nr:cobyric acid synthase [Methanomicrobiaceae archaeon]